MDGFKQLLSHNGALDTNPVAPPASWRAGHCSLQPCSTDDCCHKPATKQLHDNAQCMINT